MGPPSAGPLVPCTEPPPSLSPKCLQHSVFSGPGAGESSPAFPTPENSTDGSESVSGPGGLKWNCTAFLTRTVLNGKGGPGRWLDRRQVHWLRFPVWTPGLKEERRRGGQVLGTGLLAPQEPAAGASSVVARGSHPLCSGSVSFVSAEPKETREDDIYVKRQKELARMSVNLLFTRTAV